MPDQPLISFSIVSWNVRELLYACLSSIERSVTEPYEILVVDNASHDGTVEMVRKSFPNVRLIANQSNRGFAAANNQALRIARGEFVVVLNCDTELIDNPVPVLVDYLRQHQDCAAVGPEILNPDRTHQQSVRNFPTLKDQMIVALKLRHLLMKTRTMRRYMADPGADRREPLAVDQIMGAAMVIRRKILSTLGDLDEGYWIWFEEVDWCQRAKQAGYSIVYHPSAQIMHHGGQSFGQVVSFKKQRWILASLKRYAGKYWSKRDQIVLAIVTPFSLALSLLQTLVVRY